MQAGASTPEELETLLEDAFVTRDSVAVSDLFEPWAVLVPDGSSGEVYGHSQIGRLAQVMWERNHCYIAEPLRVLQARDIALVVCTRAINVARRRQDGIWRYAITLLQPNNQFERSRQ